MHFDATLINQTKLLYARAISGLLSSFEINVAVKVFYCVTP